MSPIWQSSWAKYGKLMIHGKIYGKTDGKTDRKTDGKIWDLLKQRRSMSHDKVKNGQDHCLDCLHLRETRQRAEQLPDIQIIVASGPQNTTRHIVERQLSTQTQSWLPLPFNNNLASSVGCFMSFRKNNIGPHEEVGRTDLRRI